MEETGVSQEHLGDGGRRPAGVVAGIIFWGGFNTAMEATNELGFCISCHEMRDTVYQEYKTTIHFKNPAGVRAVCSDCHVPKDWTHKIIRKVQASNELWHKIIGTIDTPEKFQAHRAALAKDVWKTMKETDSRECRNCHSNEAMDFAHQKNADDAQADEGRPGRAARPASIATRASPTSCRT